MEKEKFIELVKAQQELYLHESQKARERMNKYINEMTAQQIAQEVIFIQDMESRSYAMKLLIEDLEEF